MLEVNFYLKQVSTGETEKIARYGQHRFFKDMEQLNNFIADMEKYLSADYKVVYKIVEN